MAHEWRSWYDALGRLFAVRDALGNTTRIEYDPLGRKVSMDDPSMGHWTYGYDLAGNLTRQTDAVGNVLTFTYDALNRLITKVGSPVGGAPATLAEYAYDSGTWAIGHRIAMTDTSGVTTWTYDPLGRMLGETRVVAGGLGSYTTGWAYDAAGRVVTQTYPTGEEVVTAYNLRGLPVSVDSADITPGYLTAATYNTLGQVTSQAWGNNLTTAYSYDAKNARLLQMQLGSLLDLRYRYDKVGNILAITSTVNSNQVQTFTYDARDRLLTAQTNAAGNGQYSEAYGYNALGNIITRTISGAGQTYYYGRPSAGGLTYKFYLPLVTGDGAAEFDDPTGATFGQPFAVISTTAGYRAAYDLNGSQTLRVSGGITYTQQWDVENRLAVMTNTVSGVVTRFTYDGDGNRVIQTVGTASTLYIGSHYEKDITSGTVTMYYYAGGQRIALRQGGTVSWLSGDHLGSTTLTMNNAGAKTSELLYSPFGTSRYSWGTAPTSYGFTGQRADATGLIYFVARYYDPAVGRWTQADSLVPNPGNPQALNRYTYVSNSPTNRIDAAGHDDKPWWQRDSCEVFSFICQPSPNFMFELAGPLAVDAGETTLVPATQTSFATKHAQGRKGGLEGAYATLRALLTGGSAKLMQDGTTKLCADGDCTNELNSAVQQIKAAEQLPGNVGIAWYDIGGIVSRIARGSAIPAGQNPTGWIFRYESFTARAHSESRILEALARRFMSNPQVSGTIHLFTYKHPCATCTSVIDQFRAMFPNIQVYIYYFEEYP